MTKGFVCDILRLELNNIKYRGSFSEEWGSRSSRVSVT